MLIIEAIFWASLILIFYTYCIYPIIIFIFVQLKNYPKPEPSEKEVPSVSMIISVFNEENILQEKLNNIKNMQYPTEKMEILFGSDGSTDHTNDILNQANIPNLIAYTFRTRRGKAAVLNELVKMAKGDIIVFSDANTFYSNNTVQKLIIHFSDTKVGAVCGELILKNDIKNIGGIGESSYWTYENFLKKLESTYKTIISATGGVYAIRKNLFKPLPTTKAVTDDFLIPIEIIKRGFQVKYEPNALAFEKTSGSISGEFERKVRIGAQNFNILPEIFPLLHFRYGFVAFALWSHKIIRWLVPFFLLFTATTSILLGQHSVFYQYIVFCELIFIIIAILGFVSDKLNVNIGFIGFPYYVIVMNFALFIGFIKSIFKKQKTTWNVIR